VVLEGKYATGIVTLEGMENQACAEKQEACACLVFQYFNNKELFAQYRT
jgi:hypothetical protein